MSIHPQNDAGKEEGEEEVDADELSGSEDDDSFSEDMEALKQACLRTGTDLNALQIAAADASDSVRPITPDAAASAAAVGSDSEDDLELFRSIRNRLALSSEPEPLCTLLPTSDCDDEDDFETLRLIQRRFSSYSLNDTFENSTEHLMEKADPVYTTIMPVEDATRDVSCENFQNYEKDGNSAHLSSDNVEIQNVDLIQWDQSDGNELSTLTDKSSRFPKSAQLLIDAIKKNRSYQKFLRTKLSQIEVKIEENKKLKERVKVLKDFQSSCKKLTSRALSMKKDPRLQLISARKARTFQDPTINDTRVSANYGPPENSTVANYRMALTRFSPTLQRKKWSREERENLEKGIKQQFQERVLQVSVDLLSNSNGSSGDGNNLDDIIATVKDLEITPEKIREFTPQVNWDQLASMYAKGRSGVECETRWLNHEDPLINRNPWTSEEDKKLLAIKERGISNWLDIAVLLGSNRTPFQCLARYQRSWNSCILKREWTAEEDDQLRIAVEEFGEHDWQSVASTLTGRSGTQCSNRWKKSLHPARQRVGRWTPVETTRLKVAVMLFGPRNWRKIAEVVPGRTEVQCRERWVNCLDPNLNFAPWTKDEDLILKAAVKEHGFRWSKIASCYFPSRVDYQCQRRWEKLHPEIKLLLKEEREKRKEILPSNFVDRASERPALSANGFDISLPMITLTSEPENSDQPSIEKRKPRRSKSKQDNDAALSKHFSEKRRQSRRKKAQACSVDVPSTTIENEADVASKQTSQCLESNNCTEPAKDVPIPKKRKRKLPSGSDNYTEPAEDVAIRKKRRKQPILHTNCIGREQDDAIQTDKRRPRSESNICIEEMQDNSSSHPLSTLYMATNREDESFGSSLPTKKKKNPKLPLKKCSKRKEHPESCDEQNSVCSVKAVFSGAADGTRVMRNSGAEVDILGVDEASTEKSNARPRSKRKATTTSNISTSQSPRSSSAGRSLSTNKNSEKRKISSFKHHCRSGSSNDLSGDSDDITLAAFLQDKLKKNIPSLAHEDEMTLSCFIRNKSKKGR